MTDHATKPNRYLLAMREPQVWRRTLLLGLPVGLLQAGLNQGDYWWHGQVDATVITKTILSPLLSCSIALASAIGPRATKKLDPNPT